MDKDELESLKKTLDINEDNSRYQTINNYEEED